jgi:DNA-binding response OmpR family regulator
MLGGVRLLVIEDERELARTLRRGLNLEGFAVDLAHDGREGLWLARTGEYGGIILDLMLPGLNGYKVCEALRRERIETPILVLTAKDGDYDQAEALDTGADDYLVKPFSYVVLLARVRALVRRTRTSGSPLLTVGDLVLDVMARTCRRAGKPVSLTPREFAIADMLARRPGEVVPKTEIMHRVWPDEVDDVNLVEARVSGLRRKIDGAFGRDSLQTVRGLGYRLVDDRASRI